MNRAIIALLLALAFAGCSGSKPNGEKNDKPVEPGQVRLVEMGIEAQKHVGLKVAPATVQTLSELLEVTGTVQPIDSQVGHIRPLANGRLQEVLAKVGDRVATGQPLARFDYVEVGDLTAQYQSAQADLAKLQAQHVTAAKQLDRNRHLVEIGAVPQKDVESSQAEEEALQASIRAQESLIAGLGSRLNRFGIDGNRAETSSIATIRSPFAGVVIKAAAAPGEVIDANSELFQIADLSRVWVQAEVYEKDLGRIRAGQMAIISVDTYPGETFTGKMTYLGDILDPQTRTVKVRCEVPNPGIKLKLDMFASVSLPTTFSRKTLAVPTASIQQIESKNVVFIQKTTTTFEPREVNIGKAVEGRTEIVSGLMEGETVVTDGAFHLKSIVLGGTLGEEEQR